jgi:methanethiol S-methyltransferase
MVGMQSNAYGKEGPMDKPTDDAACKLSAVEAAQARQAHDGQWISRGPGALLLVGGAYLLGGGGMAAWLAFLLLGAPGLLEIHPHSGVRLLLDGLLCLLFFIQHSLMVRRRFRIWLTRRVRADFHGALYATAAGGCLLLLVGLWQPVGTAFWVPSGWIRSIFGVVFLAAGLAAAWGARSLGDFDALGVKPALAVLRRQGNGEPSQFIIRGPYRWVRHPLYLFSLIIIWAGPVFTIDRMLHNACWTVWVLIGAVMEERDLAACFGDAYRSYQKRVPMLIPTHLKPMSPEQVETPAQRG